MVCPIGIRAPDDETAYFPEFAVDQTKGRLKDHLSTFLYFDFHYTLLPTILRNFDRMSMASGIEIRAPLLDWRLVCYSFSLASNRKLNPPYSKEILRNSVKGLIPEPIRLRQQKIGFATPFEIWLKNGLDEKLMDTVSGSSFKNSDIWDGPKIKSECERIYKEKSYSEYSKFWGFIQSDILQNTFSTVDPVYN